MDFAVDIAADFHELVLESVVAISGFNCCSNPHDFHIAVDFGLTERAMKDFLVMVAVVAYDLRLSMEEDYAQC